MSSPFVIIGRDPSGAEVRRFIVEHFKEATVYTDVDGQRYRVYDFDHDHCGMRVLNFCGIIVETVNNIAAFESREFFDDVLASIVATSVKVA